MTPHPRSPLAGLFAAPGRFDFFQAVRLLDRGSNGVTLRVLPNLRFPAGAVAAATPATAADPAELVVPFGGLTGPDGILPQHYTALLLSRLKARDTSLRDWLDLFHHRTLELLHRAWEKTHWAAAVDRRRAGGPATADPATTAAFAAGGFGTPNLTARAGVPPDVLVYYAGLLSRQPRPPAGLGQMLGEYFGWPVRVEPFAGRWLYLDADTRAELPAGGVGGANAGLGTTAVVGRRVWDVQGMVRVVVGPVGYPAFASLLPGGRARQPLAALARLYLGLELDIEVRVTLEADAVPWAELTHDEAAGPRLGRTAWVRTHQHPAPVADTAFDVP